MKDWLLGLVASACGGLIMILAALLVAKVSNTQFETALLFGLVFYTFWESWDNYRHRNKP